MGNLMAFKILPAGFDFFHEYFKPILIPDIFKKGIMPGEKGIV